LLQDSLLVAQLIVTQTHAAASWVKRLGGAESCNFPTYSCKLPAEDIVSARPFNFSSQFPQNGGL